MSNSLFAEAVIEQAYVKAGLFGFAASGKTMTASLLMIATILECRRRGIPQADKPVYFQATEPGVDFVVPLFEHFKVPLRVTRRRDFASVIPALTEAEENGSGYIIDSVTHPWTEFMEAYMRKTKRRYIQFEDWRFLKQEWAAFTSAFMNSNIHAISCGRAGFEYDYHEREDGKKELEKTGIKVKTEGEFAFEPSLLVLMEREIDLDGQVSRVAQVIKDRWAVIDGMTIPFRQVGPNGKKLTYDQLLEQAWKAFSPHVLKLNLGGAHKSIDTTSESARLVDDDGRGKWEQKKLAKEVLVEKIASLLEEHGAGGTSVDAKKKRIDLYKRHFGTTSGAEIEKVLDLEVVKKGLDAMCLELTGQPYFPPKEIA
ncbi:MAG: hypothetical protein IT349_19465 [Candidatus Eisenbacteria bacterium]|nr:hypothetical protein [Candidatus Eisenbacteria bacterium]